MSNMPEDLQQVLDKLLESGSISEEEVLSLRQAAGDPAVLDLLLSQLKQEGADQIGPPPLNIEQYYHAGTTKYKLQWPLRTTLPLPFDQIDHKTQFFVLFQEWTQRELDGITALNSGKTDAAKAIYDECLARAQQLQVGELVARSYEGLMRYAQKLSDQKAEREWSELAIKARSKDE
jgi:hypothetical protein